MDPTPEAVGSSSCFLPTRALTVPAVADLLDMLEAADVRATIEGLEQTLAVMKPAAGARDVPAGVGPTVLRAALQLRRRRRDTSGEAS